MNKHHDDMDDTAEFASTRFWPGEASTEIGAEPESEQLNDAGMGPWVWLALGVAAFCGFAALAIPAIGGA